jgi:hypothetical protein
MGLLLEPLHFQFQGNDEEVHVSPPRKITLSPALGVVDAQVLEQFDIPGACCQGVVFAVPLFESEPFAAT